MQLQIIGREDTVFYSSQETRGTVSHKELTGTEELCPPAHPLQSYWLLDGSGCGWWGGVV